jgi:hypothetical protein
VLYTETIFFHVYKATYLNEEVNCTEPSPSARVPCIIMKNLPRKNYLVYFDLPWPTNKKGFITLRLVIYVIKLLPASITERPT